MIYFNKYKKLPEYHGQKGSVEVIPGHQKVLLTGQNSNLDNEMRLSE